MSAANYPGHMTADKVPADAVTAAERHWLTFINAGVEPPCLVHAFGRWYKGVAARTTRCGRKVRVRYQSATSTTWHVKVVPLYAILPIVAKPPQGRTNCYQATEVAAEYWLKTSREIKALLGEGRR